MLVTGTAGRFEPDLRSLLKRWSPDPPDAVEIRQKDAADRELLALLSAARASLPRARIFANARFDLAMAAGADGVILPADGLPVDAVRRETPREFHVGRSTHSAAEAARAIGDGADTILIGPIFDSPSKRRFGPPLGPDSLAELPPLSSHESEIYAIGGIDVRAAALLRPYHDRITGIAAIRLFEESADPTLVMDSLRAGA